MAIDEQGVAFVRNFALDFDKLALLMANLSQQRKIFTSREYTELADADLSGDLCLTQAILASGVDMVDAVNAFLAQIDTKSGKSWQQIMDQVRRL